MLGWQNLGQGKDQAGPNQEACWDGKIWGRVNSLKNAFEISFVPTRSVFLHPVIKNFTAILSFRL